MEELDPIKSFETLQDLSFSANCCLPSRRCAATELELMLLIAAFEIKNMNLAVLVSPSIRSYSGAFPVNTWHSVVWLTLASSASYVLRDDDE